MRASVHVERDPTSGDETQETYDPNSSVALSMTRSEERREAMRWVEFPGPAVISPTPKARQPPSPTADSNSTKTETGTYAVNRTVRHTIQPAGRIKRIAAALLVDDATDSEVRNNQRIANRRKRTPEEMKQIEGLARAALGLDTAVATCWRSRTCPSRHCRLKLRCHPVGPRRFSGCYAISPGSSAMQR